MKKTWLLGFGFFSISLTWALYNAFVPLFLKPYISSAGLIGFLMTLDNYFALFLQPIIGSRSDRTSTRFGRRMPYLLLGMPLAAVFTMLIPLHSGLIMLVLLMLFMNVSMSLYRSPTVALMPDITPPSERTRANGVINFMGGVGSIIAFGAGSILYDVNPAMPFLTAGMVTLLSLLILIRFVKESAPSVQETSHKDRLPSGLRAGTWRKELNRSTILLLAAIFFWFIGYQGVEALFTLYGTEEAGMSDSEASFSLAFFSLSFVIFAIPCGWLGKKLGKKKTIIIGILGLMAVFAVVPAMQSVTALRILLLVGGMFWAAININSYPLVVASGSEGSIGTRTGLYYLVSSLAAISSPPLLGLLVDAFGYDLLFYAAACGLLLALLFILGVQERSGSLPGSSSANGTENPIAG